MTNRVWRLRFSRAVAATLLLALAAGGLAPRSSGAQGEEQTLTIWDQNTSGVQLEIIQTLADEFEQSHPGVTVEHRALPLEELQDTLQRAVGSGEGPDVAQINNGESVMGPMVRAGLLVPLDTYAEQYGWRDILSPALIEALCMARALPADEFRRWFAAFLPRLDQGEPRTLFVPATVSDRSDGKIAHLDGLNLSRAWCWRSLGYAEPAKAHLASALPHLASDYMGEHWLVSFALLGLITEPKHFSDG